MTQARREVEIKGVSVPARLHALLVERMTRALAPLAGRPLAATVTFFDENGPKGGRAWRCALTVRLPYRPGIRIERTSTEPRLAFDAAYPVLERQLARYREVDRDRRRRPKKYFAARRALAGDGARPRRRRPAKPARRTA
jgi:ribosome-associated translation inhibitor RaiA